MTQNNAGAVTLPLSQEQRHALVLRAWEAINAERELPGVLAAVADVLVPVVPFTGVAVIAHELNLPLPYALHAVGIPPREGESVEELINRVRAQNPTPIPLPARECIPYEGSELERCLREGRPYTCADLFEKKGWYKHEFKQAAAGVRAYTSIPLYVRGKPIGTSVFTRFKPIAFTPDELTVLSEVSRAIGVAVANALANEEIRKLRDQLEAENIALRTQLNQMPWFDEIVGDSPKLRRVLEAVEQVAVTDATVLITGETGTGKELIARAIHRRSPRSGGPLVKVNCAAIPETLLASELFGHERGAFTGAVERRKGRFEQAHRGTLFLDEIGELPMETQVMLLRVLQEREFERVGGSETVRVDVRVVTATNRDLAEEVRAGRFRRDLYYRLNVFPVRLPPLRERPEDVSLLAAHFVAKHGARFGRTITRIDRHTMNLLESHHWPGNVRELENVVERAVILARNGTLRVDREALPGTVVAGDMEAQLQTQEQEAIEAALRVSRGRIAGPKGAARRLGLAPSTLEFRIRRLGIDKFRFRAEAEK
ncbi:MAG TPA: sigma 54-interacting transcriptional regulator [Blastocatellia bacterium]|nr:sigma 54-interacting transcriptional regulator [Blastocatellia bacterium]